MGPRRLNKSILSSAGCRNPTLGALRRLRFPCPPPFLGERSAVAQLCLLTMDFSPPAVSLFSLQSEVEPPWLKAGESPALMPAPVQTSKELGILPGVWDGTQGDTGRSLRWDRVRRVGGCHELGDIWGAGARGITPKLVLAGGLLGTTDLQGISGGSWGHQDGAIPLLNPGWRCPLPPTSPASLLGQSGTVAGLPDKEPLVMKCLLSSSVPVGPDTQPTRAKVTLFPLGFYQPVSYCRRKKT